MSSAFDLYQHSFGQKKNIFTVKPAILRGLVVAFFNAGKCEFARSVFMHGIFTDVYPIKKVYCYYLLFRVLFIFIWSFLNDCLDKLCFMLNLYNKI